MRKLLLVALVGSALVGCSSSDVPELKPLSVEEQAALKSISADGLKELLASHRGKPVALAVWSARDEASVAAFRKLGELSGAVVVALNIDRVDDVRAKALPVVQEVKPAFESRVFEGDYMQLEAFLGMDWSGRVPAIFVHDGSGSRVGGFYGKEALAEAKDCLRGL